jgi:hypothetical protein
LKHTAFAHSIDVLGRRKKDLSNPLIKLFQGHVSKINIIPVPPPRAISQTRLQKGGIGNNLIDSQC